MDVTVTTQTAGKAKLPADLAEVFDYWTATRGDAAYPSWRAFKLDELPLPLIPWAVVVDVIEAPDKEPDFIYRFWGTMRAEFQGQDPTGQSVHAIEPPDIAHKVFLEFMETFETGEAQYIVTKIEYDERETSHWETLRLPLSDDGKTINKIFGVSTRNQYTRSYFEALKRAPPINYVLRHPNWFKIETE